MGWSSPSELHIDIEGEDLTPLMNEPGGHRIQRVPPTERNGRVHTSTVTVAVLDASTPTIAINEADFRLEWFSGTGAGGQHRNKHQNSARITHIPTGMVETAQCRSREASRREAMDKLVDRITAASHGQHHGVVSATRKIQLGSGMRGDKIRTYRFQDDVVTDHVTGKRANLTKVMNGHFDKLWR